MKKLLLTAFLVFTLFASVVQASSVSSTKDYTDPTTGETIGAAFKVNADGSISEISLEQFAKEEAESMKIRQEINSLQKAITLQKANTPDNNSNSSINPTSLITYFYDYDETENKSFGGTRVKVSNSLACPSNASQPCSISVGWSTTTTAEYSANVGASLEKRATIQGGVGFTWSSSSSSSTNYSFPVNAGKKAYIGFFPKLNYTKGNLIYYQSSFLGLSEISRDVITATSPRKLSSGETEGTFVLVYE